MTLAPPLLSKTDEYGTGLGLLSAGQYLTSSALQKVHSFSYITVADLGEGPRGPPSLFLDQTEAQRAGKKFLFGDWAYVHTYMFFIWSLIQ